MDSPTLLQIAQFLDPLTIEQLSLVNKEFYTWISSSWRFLLSKKEVPACLTQFSDKEIYFTLQSDSLCIRRRLSPNNPYVGYRTFKVDPQGQRLHFPSCNLEAQFNLPKLAPGDLILIMNGDLVESLVYIQNRVNETIQFNRKPFRILKNSPLGIDEAFKFYQLQDYKFKN